MKEAEEALWKKYRSGDREAYESLVDHYLPLVKITIGRMAINLPGFIDYEELYSTGCVGLISAVERYDPSRQAKFSTYAITRIRGSVIDELRNHDALGRVTRDRVTRIRQAEESLRSQGRAVTPQDVQKASNLSPAEYTDALLCERACRMVSLSEPVEGVDGYSGATVADMLTGREIKTPGLNFEDREIMELVMGMLTDREKQLVSLYYHEEMTLKEIGAVMQISESRVSQLHAEMVERIRHALTQNEGGRPASH